MIRILAYCREDVIKFSRASGLRAGRFSYVRGARDLIGTKKALIVLVEGWENRPDADELRREMVLRESVCLEMIDIGKDDSLVEGCLMGDE